MTKIEKFAKLAKEKFDIELDINSFHRTYAGYWQREEGAWSWYMHKKASLTNVGSTFSITELLKNKKTITLDKTITSDEMEFYIW